MKTDHQLRREMLDKLTPRIGKVLEGSVFWTHAQVEAVRSGELPGPHHRFFDNEFEVTCLNPLNPDTALHIYIVERRSDRQLMPPPTPLSPPTPPTQTLSNSL